MRHMTECLVVTSPDDHETQDVACSVPGVSVFETDAFTRHGARFNKGLAFEEGFDRLGRHGWIVIFDSDILFPPEMQLAKLQPTKLYGCHRRILEDPSKWSETLDWKTCPVWRDGGAPIGFFQLFHAGDPVLKNRRLWYEPTYPHAGGCDDFFMNHWHPDNRVILPSDVLHLGKVDTNWWGVDQTGRDMMARFCKENGWHRAAARFPREAAARAPELIERIEVPGYEPTGHQLPFVARAKKLRDRRP